jgi:hypothetical protein
MDTKSDTKNLCKIIFKDNRNTTLSKKMINRFGLLSAQESKDNTYDLHTVDIEEFLSLLDQICIPSDTFHLNVPDKYKKLYDYLITDTDLIRSKQQFTKVLLDRIHADVLSITTGYADLKEMLLKLVYRNIRYNIHKCKDGDLYVNKLQNNEYYACVNYTYETLNIPAITINHYDNNNQNLLDKPFVCNNYKITSLYIVTTRGIINNTKIENYNVGMYIVLL